MSTPIAEQKWIVGVTGASGMPYALRLLEVLASQVKEVHVVFSEAALRVLQEEEDIAVSPSRISSQVLFGREIPTMFFYNPKDIGAVIASGSALFEGMVIVPCSMGTLGAVAQGYGQNLVHRAADVTIKEGRRLVIVPRETPLSKIHLRNMLSLAEMGVSIVPAMPGFYHKPQGISELVDMMVMKILDQMRIPNALAARWRDNSGTGSDAGAGLLKEVKAKV
jgi:4-hydroxy-3-polyprenylbenzoate decarboxylase